MTSNPMLTPRVIENVMVDSKPMTIQGTINKSLILLGLVILSGTYAWNLVGTGFTDKAQIIYVASAIVGLILAIVTSFKPHLSKYTAPAYALVEGLFVGTVSAVYNAAFQGIVLDAVSLTVLTLVIMLFLYKSQIIRATARFQQVIAISTLAVLIFYLAGWIGAFLGHPMTVFNGSIMGIVISSVICIIAALNFILDFDFIVKGEQNNLPGHFEWYYGFGLLVTLIWLYLEILRLLAQFAKRR